MLSIGDQASEEEESDNSQSTKESCDSKRIGLDETELDSEAELMRSMGLPLQFGGMSAYENFEVSINFYYFYLLVFSVKSHGIF